MHKTFLITGSILSGLAVALGAFGAHGLKKIATAETVATYQTGVQYQIYHALALILVGILAGKFQNGSIQSAGIFFIAGMILFSGSLYLIVALQAASKAIPTPVALLTPLGGVCFIIGWLLLVIGLARS
jgi:uncharacterized membrane protein YgdD (TMEM256/DUF423 family)